MIANEQHLSTSLSFFLACATLTACGGGGGTAVPALPVFEDALIVPHAKVEEAAGKTAEAAVSYTSSGIVKYDGTGIVSTSFARASTGLVGLGVTVGQKVFNTTTQSVENTLHKRPLPTPPIRRHLMRDWTLFETSGSGAQVANVFVSWHNEDPTDYLAGGYWMSMDGGLDDASISEVDIGTFIDGPEFSGTPTLPVDGKAHYRGRAAGMYTYSYGPMWQPLDPRLENGLKETGEYSGATVFEVDFAGSTIQGCIGCVENLETTGAVVYPDGRRDNLYTNLSLASIKFAPTAINQDGTFGSSSVSLVIGDPILQVNLPVTGVSGSWGGRFSNRQAADGSGDPRLLAGTSGIRFGHPDGSSGVFVGNFFATKEITE